jgi:hypothetical protein
MFNRFTERLCWCLAWSMPERLAYYAAVRVVCYASVTKFRNTPMGDIGAQEALGHWHDTKLSPDRSRATANAAS